MAKKVLAFDLGASSGRAILGEFDGEKLELSEIHRFENSPVSVNGTLSWDILRLFAEIKTGIDKALQKGEIDSIGIDTWGVDFGLLDKKGKLLSNPVHYRDLRTEGMPQKLIKTISKRDIYSKTGIQFMRINTLYQLYYLACEDSELLPLVDKILLMPDLLSYFLTGEKHCERTNASTTNMYNPAQKNWEKSLFDAVGISTEIFPPFIRAGETYGKLSAEICEEFSCNPIPVISVGSHDTASAVVAVPSSQKDFVYISCGTWSLFGTENDVPILTQQAEQFNFTNEIGVNDTVRLLKNIMGLWLIQQSRNHWLRHGDDVTFNMLEKEALDASPFKCFIDPDDACFELPGNLPRRVREFCEKTHQFVPQTKGEIMRCIYQSLALKYRKTFDDLKSLTGKNYNFIHMLGGGIKDSLLCQMTANATNVTVKAGPVEATAMGNIALQYIGLGAIKDLSQAREIITNSTQIKVYEPIDSQKWEAALAEYKTILK